MAGMRGARTAARAAAWCIAALAWPAPWRDHGGVARAQSAAAPSPAAGPPAASGPTAAEPDAIVVTWEAPAACPSAKHLDEAIDRLLGGSPEPSTRRVQVRGVVTARGEGFDLALETEDERGLGGRRALSGATCEALTDAAALVVALGWDPAAVAAARARPRDTAPAPPVPPPTTPAPASLPPPARPTAAIGPVPFPVVGPLGSQRPSGGAPAVRRSPRVALGIGGLLEAGGLPGLAAGLTGWAALLVGSYRVEIGAAGLPSSEAALATDTERGGRFGQVLGTASVCRALVPWTGAGAHHELAGCLGMEGGATFATGFGVDQERDATVPWLAPRTGVTGRLELARGLGLRADLHLAVPLVRDRFVLDDLGAVHRPAPVAGRAAAGLDLRF